MADLQDVLSGLLTGGASALTTLLATFRDLRKRLQAVEDVDAAFGKRLQAVEDRLQKFQHTLDSWESEPPAWVSRVMSKSRRSVTTDMEQLIEMEERIEQRLQGYALKLKRLQDDLDNLEDLDNLVTKAEFDRAHRNRTEEILALRKELATANGLLRGIMSALGYLDSLPPPKKP